MEQRISFCTTSDGVSIAYATVGDGPPLVYVNAGAGEILASNVVREPAAGKGFLFAERGETALRGFEDPVRIYELRWQEP